MNLLSIRLLAIFLILFSINNSNAEVVDRVIAVVNEDVITKTELEDATETFFPDPKDRPQKEVIITQLIEQILLEQEAKKNGITISEAEVDRGVELVKNQFNLNEQDFNEVLKKQNLTPELFREQWRTQMLGNKLIKSKLQGQVAVTEDEIRKYYEENYGKIEPSEEVHIAHILIPSDQEEKAIEVANMAKSGEDFESLAKEHSIDTISAEKGGELGYFKKGDLVEPLENATQNAEIGEIVGPISSPSGFHIIKILDKTESGEDIKYIENRNSIREVIYEKKATEALKNWLEEMKNQAYIEVKY